MKCLDKLAAEVAKMTAGPWRPTDDTGVDYEEDWSLVGEFGVCRNALKERDATGIARLRNLAPALIAVASQACLYVDDDGVPCEVSVAAGRFCCLCEEYAGIGRPVPHKDGCTVPALEEALAREYGGEG